MLLFDPLVIALKCFHFGQLMSVFFMCFFRHVFEFVAYVLGICLVLGTFG